MSGLPSWAQVTPKRREHIERVVTLVESWAEAMGVSPAEKSRWARAAWLHDALKDAPVEQLAPFAPAGWTEPALFHGPAAAARAAKDGEKDQGVLDAAKYHSVGYVGWDSAGRMLYLADYLEPGRRARREQKAAFAVRVPTEPEKVLHEIVTERLGRSDIRQLPESAAFWKSIVRND